MKKLKTTFQNNATALKRGLHTHREDFMSVYREDLVDRQFAMAIMKDGRRINVATFTTLDAPAKLLPLALIKTTEALKEHGVEWDAIQIGPVSYAPDAVKAIIDADPIARKAAAARQSVPQVFTAFQQAKAHINGAVAHIEDMRTKYDEAATDFHAALAASVHQLTWEKKLSRTAEPGIRFTGLLRYIGLAPITHP